MLKVALALWRVEVEGLVRKDTVTVDLQDSVVRLNPLEQLDQASCDGCADDEPEDVDIVSWDRIAEALNLARCPGGEEQN